MTLAFHPAADWPGPLQNVVDRSFAAAAKTEASGRVERALPVPWTIYSVGPWLQTAPADNLVADFAPCLVAADHWNARIACPTQTPTSRRLRRYIELRMAEAAPLIAAALARWAVLERIPVNWIPVGSIRAAVTEQLRRLGLEMDVTGLRLIPPVLGGSEWVRQDCGQNIALLQEHAADAAVAAILHWPERTAAAVVIAQKGRLHAYGPTFGHRGLDFDPADLLGAALALPVAPPTPLLYRLLRWVGLGTRLWTWVRRGRVRKGESADATL